MASDANNDDEATNNKTLHVNLDADDAEMFRAVRESLDAGSDAAATRQLIRDAYDSLDTGGYWYDPTDDDGDRRHIETDTRREIFRRYDAPAVNPSDVGVWPRSQREKAQLLAAICRYEAVELNAKDDGESEIKDVIRRTLGPGTDGRNLDIYPEMVFEILDEAGPKDADNMPPAHVVPGVESVDEWFERADDLLADDKLGDDAYREHAARGRQIISAADGDISEDVEEKIIELMAVISEDAEEEVSEMVEELTR